ncbi:MAG: hypothetical protein HKN20_04545, partial [Gemmatimonadetes bacterium]|nr:hypothetical protein [Gemmatimonadota bacterium]
MKAFHDESEYAVKPTRVIVHDPTTFGAFDASPSESREPAAFLFRETPDPALLAKQHARFVALLEEHVPVAKMADLIPAEHQD